MKDYKLAQEFFEYVAKIRCDANSWFNVITSAVLAHNLDNGYYAFERTTECQEQYGYSQQPSLPSAKEGFGETSRRSPQAQHKLY